jgi:hypothetical protein
MKLSQIIQSRNVLAPFWICIKSILLSKAAGKPCTILSIKDCCDVLCRNKDIFLRVFRKSGKKVLYQGKWLLDKVPFYVAQPIEAIDATSLR